jgi:hypothetical protein
MASLVVDTCGSHRCVAVARRVTHARKRVRSTATRALGAAGSGNPGTYYCGYRAGTVCVRSRAPSGPSARCMPSVREAPPAANSCHSLRAIGKARSTARRYPWGPSPGFRPQRCLSASDRRTGEAALGGGVQEGPCGAQGPHQGAHHEHSRTHGGGPARVTEPTGARSVGEAPLLFSVIAQCSAQAAVRPLKAQGPLKRAEPEAPCVHLARAQTTAVSRPLSGKSAAH